MSTENPTPAAPDQPGRPDEPQAAAAEERPTSGPAPLYGEYAPPSAAPQPVAPPPGAGLTGGAGQQAAPGALYGAFAGGGYPQVVATYTKYEDAQAAVDQLSDEGFPVENVSIVGHDIRTVENVSGRLTNGKAAGRGALSGIWFGVFLGFLFAIFASANLGVVLITAIVAGAVWGALFGFVSHAMTRGRRDFSSTKTMEAGRYEVMVRAEFSARASQVLSQATYGK